MVTLQDVLIDALWLLGLAGLLATAGTMGWVRQVDPRLNHRPWRHTLQTPRSRTPLALSLALIASGVALNGLVGKRPDPVWAVVAWFLLSFLFIIQTVYYAWIGDQHGWDSSMEGNRKQ